jgi:UDP-glucose 4-epimerase
LLAESRKVLVTGGAGFIGSHLVDRLVELGHKVVVVDNLSTGRLRNLSTAVTFSHTDISTPAVNDLFVKEKPEIIFHHAAQASVVESLRDPVRDAEVNVLGSLRMVDNAMRHGVKKFIFASTGGAIYGDPQYVPCDEAHPVMPLSPYGLAKHVVERYLDLLHQAKDLNYTALRYANVYGPRQDPHGEAGVIAIFSRLMLEGERPKIFGDGDQERDFVYVSDVVEANLLAVDAPPGSVYNIGTSVGTSVNGLFAILKKALGFRWKPDYQPERGGEVFKISLDYTSAHEKLGWSPRVSLEEGLGKTLEYYRQAVRT